MTTRETTLEGVYPIVFRVQIPVQGADYSSGVELRGGAVVTTEPDGFLAHGLKPGGVAGVGATLVEAYLDLKTNIELALYELAAESANLDEFKRAVRSFFHDTDSWAAATFEAARKKVAAGDVDADLPVKENPALRHRVVVFEAPLPKNNPKPLDVVLASWPEAA